MRLDVISPDAYVDWFRNNVAVSHFTQLPQASSIDRVRASDLEFDNCELFNRNYRSVSRPVIVIDGMRQWPSYVDLSSRKWTVENLVRRFPTVEFDITHVGDGHCRMSLQHYAEYMKQQRDEVPLYVFHRKFEKLVPDLLSEYSSPRCIVDNDLLSLLDMKLRPTLRWVVIGPARSGATFHIDPLETSAWNALYEGRKRWALYPPDRDPPGSIFD